MAQKVAQSARRRLAESSTIWPDGMRRTKIFTMVCALLVGACTGSGSEPIPYPTGADDIVLQISVHSGSEQPDQRFSPPVVLVTGAGVVVRAAPDGAEVEGQFLPTVWTQTITPAGIEGLLEIARDGGLFADRAYDADVVATDQPTTTVTLTTDDGSWTHIAHALGTGGPTPGVELTPERQALHDVVERLRAIDSAVDAEALGEVEFYFPDEYLFLATPAAAATGAVVPWTEFASVALADASTCQRLPEVEVGEVFVTAASGSVFDDEGQLYEVVAVPVWPGADC